jgi:membrane associated rhomboid family serine protease
MAFSDRTYVRGSSNLFPQGVRWLLIVNVALYLVFFIAVHSGYDALFYPFYLSPGEVVGSLALWQLVTYMFLHDPFGFGHILFNMLALWMFGADLERQWGRHEFLKFYFVCGIGAGICVVVANLLFGEGGGRTIGASGALYGLMFAFGYLWPDRTVYFSFLFPIQAKYFVMIFGAIALLSSFAAPGGPVSHLAHLGGMVVAYFYLRSRRPVRVQGAGYSGYGGAYGYQPPRKKRASLVATARNWYKEWKLQRARRKFEVYLKKHQRDRDPFVH